MVQAMDIIQELKRCGISEHNMQEALGLPTLVQEGQNGGPAKSRVDCTTWI